MFFYLSSFHIMYALMLVELFLLIFLITSMSMFFSSFLGMMVILVGVCLGALGVSLVLLISRFKGNFYFLSFMSS